MYLEMCGFILIHKQLTCVRNDYVLFVIDYGLRELSSDPPAMLYMQVVSSSHYAK